MSTDTTELQDRLYGLQKEVKQLHMALAASALLDNITAVSGKEGAFRDRLLNELSETCFPELKHVSRWRNSRLR